MHEHLQAAVRELLGGRLDLLLALGRERHVAPAADAILAAAARIERGRAMADDHDVLLLAEGVMVDAHEADHCAAGGRLSAFSQISCCRPPSLASSPKMIGWDGICLPLQIP